MPVDFGFLEKATVLADSCAWARFRIMPKLASIAEYGRRDEQMPSYRFRTISLVGQNRSDIVAQIVNY